jgi:hypothetical protein
MSAVLADSVPNPYAMPRVATIPASAPVQASKPGSLGIIFSGFVLLLLGYFTSNLLVISELYKIGMGPDGSSPPPLAALELTPAQGWMFYIASAAAFVAGAVMVGSQRYNPIAIVCYVMCPLVGLIYAVASPLRMVRKYSEIVAAGYLLVGSCLACTGATRLLALYQRPNDGIAPVLASMMTEAGLALVLGAIVKFWCVPATSPADEAPVVAELVDG